MSESNENIDFSSRLSNIRHDMRTPVGHIMGYAEILEEDLEDSGSAEFLRDLTLVHGAGERLIALIDEHLGASKKGVEELDLHEAQFQMRGQLNHIAGYTEMLREVAEDDELEKDVHADLGRIADAATFLLNYIGEKLKPVSFEGGALKSDEFGLSESDDKASVVSEGTFEPEGLGSGGRILVVDDNSANRDLLTRRLERHGYDVLALPGGREALDYLENDSADLILLDLMMPDINGLETLDHLKADKALRNIPVIMLSAADDADKMVQCILHGAEEYVFKPFNPVLLRARIGTTLEKYRLRQQFAKRLKVFISSPGDVIPERQVVKQVIQQLNDEYSGRVYLVPILWEEEPLLASDTFQAQIQLPRKSDIYIGILWSRMGSPLPETIVREDGSRYESGTAFEFEDAMAGCKEHGKPDMLVYHKQGAPEMSLADRDAVTERLNQIDTLTEYIARWFTGEDGSFIGAIRTYDDLEEFESMVRLHLRKLVETRLD